MNFICNCLSMQLHIYKLTGTVPLIEFARG